MPLTLAFGPWAPDLKDTPLTAPDQPGPVEIPLADVMNLFYANGSYQNIASAQAAAIDGNAVKALMDTPVGAYSVYDTIEEQETVFVGSPTGLWQLNADGSWTSVNIVVNQAGVLVGAAAIGTVANFANALQAKGLIATTQTGVLSPFQNTTTIVAGSSSVNNGAGYPSTTLIGFSKESSPGFGSIAINRIAFGSCVAVYDQVFQGSGIAYFGVAVSADPGAAAFTTITVNGVTLTSASAAYIYANGVALWGWNLKRFGLQNGSTYNVVLA